MAGLKTFVQKMNGHNAFAHPLKFDELKLQWSFFFLSITNYYFTFCSEMGNCSGYHLVSTFQFRQKVDIIPLCSEPSLCTVLQFLGRWRVLAARRASYFSNTHQLLLTPVGSSGIYDACMSRGKR